MLRVLELLEGLQRILEAVENCALYAAGTARDAPCVEVLEVVFYVLEVPKACAVCRFYILEAVEVVLEVVLYVVEAVNGVRCVLWVPGVVLCMLFRILSTMLEAGGCDICARDAGGYAPCAALYTGGR